jgi:hypothetical protein
MTELSNQEHDIQPGYRDRISKAAFLWETYRPYLEGKRILDVGADRRHLAGLLDPAASYWGVGLGGSPDQDWDLEQGRLPFADGQFDTVLCLDVLEHLESLHQVFDECCRVSSGWVIISLPNAWCMFWQALRQANPQRERALKFYGLPADPPRDRHRWFFNGAEALALIEARGRPNRMRMLETRWVGGDTATGWKKALRDRLTRLLLAPDLDLSQLERQTLWVVLEKQPGA